MWNPKDCEMELTNKTEKFVIPFDYLKAYTSSYSLRRYFDDPDLRKRDFFHTILQQLPIFTTDPSEDDYFCKPNWD